MQGKLALQTCSVLACATGPKASVFFAGKRFDPVDDNQNADLVFAEVSMWVLMEWAPPDLSPVPLQTFGH